MSPLDPAPVHARRVRELSAAGDWAGLARYWLAHQHQPALDEAVAIARRSASRRGWWPWSGNLTHPLLAEFLEAVRHDPFDRRRQLSEELVGACEPEGRETLLLLYLFPRLALCETAT